MALWQSLSWTRRKFLESGLAVPGALALGTWGGLLLLEPTPACGDDDEHEPTPAQMEGPYFKPQSPQRASLWEEGTTGDKLVLAGRVLDIHGQGVPRVLLDFWHCDTEGVYDNEGFKLRGHLFSDDAGRYEFVTILPGIYPGRTRHIHVKAQAPEQKVLTTQLYFPDEPQNQRDRIFNQKLVVDLSGADEGQRAEFDFVLKLT